MSYTNRWQNNNWSAKSGDYGSRWTKGGNLNRWGNGNYNYDKWFGSSQYYDDLLSKAALAQEALSQPEHGGANVHIFFEKEIKTEPDKSSALYAEVHTTLWVYTDRQAIKDNIDTHINVIQSQLTEQYNRGFNARLSYNSGRIENEVELNDNKTIPIHFCFDVRYFDLFDLVDKPTNALNKMRGKANEEAAKTTNYCFIHLNDGNVTANGLVGFSDGCIGSWSVGAANNTSEDPTGLPLHFAHEMAHLLGYLNVVREPSNYHYFSNEIALCQHPPISQLPAQERITIMGSNPNRQVIQQDIDNLNFGQGLLVDKDFWNSKANPKAFRNDFKYGIWETKILPENGTEHVKKVGQRRSNANLVFLTHANLATISDKIKNNKL